MLTMLRSIGIRNSTGMERYQLLQARYRTWDAEPFHFETMSSSTLKSATLEALRMCLDRAQQRNPLELQDTAAKQT